MTRTADHIVANEVIYNVSQLVQHFVDQGLNFDNSADIVESHPELFIRPDYSEAPDGEPLEFWIVSDWLAGKLEEHDECVAYDVHGLTIWGRCTSGQAISMDSVIEGIATA